MSKWTWWERNPRLIPTDSACVRASAFVLSNDQSKRAPAQYRQGGGVLERRYRFDVAVPM